MNISIISPHYNDLEGLQRVYRCLQKQTLDNWEWIIVDDFSDSGIRKTIRDWSITLENKKVNLILNSAKTNASVCRNKGAEVASFKYLVFLDSDDEISEDFIANRQIDFKDFVVFKNTAVIDKNGNIKEINVEESNYLDCFLRARFLWPITSIIWDKSFFNAIGKFHTDLPRLQDVELAIRGLQKSSDYQVIDNKIDFFYRVVPIRSRKNFVKPVCDAVYLFISELLDTQNLKRHQLLLLSGYYFLSAKYLERSSSFDQADLVRRNLFLFFKRKYISVIDYIIGFISLKFYTWKIISGKLFLRINRYIFKPKAVELNTDK